GKPDTEVGHGKPRLKAIRQMYLERNITLASLNMRVIRIAGKLTNNRHNLVGIKAVRKNLESLSSTGDSESRLFAGPERANRPLVSSHFHNVVSICACRR